MASEHKNKIGVATATIVGMNAMIGAGIFTLPSALGTYIGPAGIITTFFVAIAVWFLALSMARLAYLFPQEGSFYTYAKQWGGHFMGLLSSGAYLIGLLIAMGLLCRVAGFYIHHYFPSIPVNYLSLFTLATLVILNMFGVALSQIGQYILIVCTVLPLMITTIMCFTKANFANLFPFAPYGIKNILLATRQVIFGFFGFEAAASLVPRMLDPQKNVPKALTYSIVCVGCIYLAFVTALILAVPINLFTSPEIPVIVPLSKVFPNSQWVLSIIHFSILSAILGTLHSMIWSSSALAMSLAKLLKSKTSKKLVSLGIISPKSTVFFVGLAILTSFSTLKAYQFFSFTALFLVFAYSSSIITLLTIKKEWQSKQIFITIIGLCTALLIFSFALEGVIKTIFN